MKVAIMQPYFLPYLGYFQLISAVDKFVIFDDVNYINRGWINRNYILARNEKQLITLPLIHASQNKLINEIEIFGKNDKIVKSIQHNYSKAAQYTTTFPLIENIFNFPSKNLSLFLYAQLRDICAYLGIATQWYISSELSKDNNLRGGDKIISICKELGASQYINMPGGKALYDCESFNSHGLQLSFIQPKAVFYRQFGSEFVPHLSIIDVMMFNEREKCTEFLGNYELV